MKTTMIAILLVSAVIVAAFGWKAFRGEGTWHGKLCSLIVMIFFPVALVLMSYELYVSPLP